MTRTADVVSKHPGAVTALVLAGGEGRRVGGRDKGLELYRGRPLVDHVLERVVPQVASVVMSCNRNLDRYAERGYPIVVDDDAGYGGPMAGVHAAAPAVATPLALIVPCDMPGLPSDLVTRLAAHLAADAAVVHDGIRLQRLCLLVRAEQLGMAPAGGAVGAWLDQLELDVVDFSDVRDAFANLNTPPGSDH